MEDICKQLEQSPDYRVLRRLEVRDVFHEPDGKPLLKIAILDTESTGLEIGVDKMVELAMLIAEIDPETGIVYRIVGVFNELEDTGMPMSASATAVNGITDGMLKGKSFDDAKVTEMMADVKFVVAHNASFDRPMVEPRFPAFAVLPWVCSVREIKWREAGRSAATLDYLGLKQGFFFDAHRAEIDCRALLEVLQGFGEGGVPFLKQLVERSKEGDIRLWALNAPFEIKDVLKKRGYYWNDGTDRRPKAWHITMSRDDAREELCWMHETVYRGRVASIQFDVLDATTRFSNRCVSSAPHQFKRLEPAAPASDHGETLSPSH